MTPVAHVPATGGTAAVWVSGGGAAGGWTVDVVGVRRAAEVPGVDGAFDVVGAPRVAEPVGADGGGLGPVAQDPDAVREDACELLSPDVVCHPPSVPSLPAAGAGVLSTLAWVGLALAVAALVGLIVRAVARRVRDAERPDPVDADAVVPLADAVIDPETSPADWRERGRRHRAAGEWREALRCEYRALVGDLARRRLLGEIPGRTTGEERAQLAATAPAASGPFGEAADIFDTVWYGPTAVAGPTAVPAVLERFDRLAAEVLARTALAPRAAPAADEVAV